MCFISVRDFYGENKKKFVVLNSVLCLIVVIVIVLICYFNKPFKYYLGTDLVKYNVVTFGDFGFNLSMVYNKKNVSVEFVELLGENIENVFAIETPIEMYLQDESSNSLLEIKNRPVIISTDSLEMMNYEYVYEAADDIEIIDFDFNDFFEVSSVSVYVDNKAAGDLKNVESIAAKKGQTVRFECKSHWKDGVSQYDNIACNFFIKHKKRSG